MTDEDRILSLSTEQAELELFRIYAFGTNAERGQTDEEHRIGNRTSLR